MRESVVRVSENIQTLSASAARIGAPLPAPVGIRAATSHFLGSMRSRDPSAQLATHALPKAEIAPPHGLETAGTGCVMALVLGSRRSSVEVAAFGMSRDRKSTRLHSSHTP